MAYLVFMLMVFVVVGLGLLGCGTALGFLLHWILPRVDVGIAILIGLVTTVSTLHFGVRLMVASNVLSLEEDAEEGTADLPAFFDPEPPPRRWRRTRRKKSEE
jgi:hypothetical protein